MHTSERCQARLPRRTARISRVGAGTPSRCRARSAPGAAPEALPRGSSTDPRDPRGPPKVYV
eukprot:9342950-Pyramimonas_sp.AAC.1